MVMRVKSIILLVLSFAAGIAVKCLMSYFGFYALSFPPITRTHSASPYGSIRELNEIADNAALSFRRRAEAIFALFAHHISPGQNAVETKSILTSAKWLGECCIIPVGVIAGSVAVDCPDDCSLMTLRLFEKHPEAGLWEIDVCFKGAGNETDARKFLEGAGEKSSFKRIETFALQYAYPLPNAYSGHARTETFGRWRMMVTNRSP